MTLAEQLSAGIAGLGIELPQDAQTKLLDYLALVAKWNAVYNLTAVRDPEQMVSHHLLDCLALVPKVGGGHIADVGSGAGLPGLVLAIARPDWQITLIEANHKKATFLRQAAIELALSNVDVVCDRVENVDAAGGYDVVVSRAFSDLAEFVRLAGRLARPGGAIVAMKGLYPFEELNQVPEAFRVRELVPLAVPGLDAERHLVVLEAA